MKIRYSRKLFPIPFIALSLALSGCNGDNEADDSGDDEAAAYTLQLLHFADMDGSNSAALENVEPFSALIDAFRAERPENTLIVSSGDNYIPGPRYAAAADPTLANVVGAPGNGRGDIAFVNALGTHASAVGNHDLDEGTAAFAGLIAPSSTDSGSWTGAGFPYLSSNLDFTTDSNLAPLVADDGQAWDEVAGKVAASTVVTLDGERIGIVGASTPTLDSITSTGDITVLPETDTSGEAMYDALAAEIQPTVDALHAEGIDKIVLLAHMQQLAVERALATRLRHVDIIVGGGSNTLLADGNDVLRPADSAADVYPLTYTAPDGAPVLLVNTDGDYKSLSG